MSVAKSILYIKGEQCVEVQYREVTLGDLITMECKETNIVSKLKTIKMIKIPDSKQHRYVISILKIIERIHKEYPDLEIRNIGSPDLVVIYKGEKKPNQIWQICKAIVVVAISFVGAAFAIMTFNNDSGTSQLFAQTYELFTGQQHDGFSVLEVSYSIGLAIGILVFFNHFGKRKFTQDPTPLEVEMCLYENDIYTTLIEEASRKGNEMDVGTADSHDAYRS